MQKIVKRCVFCGQNFNATCGVAQFCSDKCHLLGSVIHDGGCWCWQSGFDKDGYGVVRLRGRRRLKAHRASYREFVGPIADGFMVCHSCDRPECINPAHLFLGTARENKSDCVSKARHVRGAGLYWKAKLTERDVLSIRGDARRAVTIADEYGVARNTVYHIKTRKTWKHV